MAKLGIIIDSSSGMTQKEAEQLGWGFLPLITVLDDVEYKDGVDLDSDKYYSMISLKTKVRTSFTAQILVQEEMEKMSKKFDHVIVYTLSKELSAQWRNAKVVAQEFPNVYVLDSKSVGSAMIDDCKILEKMYTGDNWEEVKKTADENSSFTYGLCHPLSMDWLKKGGRVSGTTAALGNLLNIIPVIALTNEGKLEKHTKGKKFDKTVLASTKEMAAKYAGQENVQFTIYNAMNKDFPALETQMKDILKEHPTKVELFPPVITNHIGVGALAIIAHRR